MESPTRSARLLSIEQPSGGSNKGTEQMWHRLDATLCAAVCASAVIRFLHRKSTAQVRLHLPENTEAASKTASLLSGARCSGSLPRSSFHRARRVRAGRAGDGSAAGGAAEAGAWRCGDHGRRHRAAADLASACEPAAAACACRGRRGAPRHHRPQRHRAGAPPAQATSPGRTTAPSKSARAVVVRCASWRYQTCETIWRRSRRKCFAYYYYCTDAAAVGLGVRTPRPWAASCAENPGSGHPPCTRESDATWHVPASATRDGQAPRQWRRLQTLLQQTLPACLGMSRVRLLVRFGGPNTVAQDHPV